MFPHIRVGVWTGRDNVVVLRHLRDRLLNLDLVARSSDLRVERKDLLDRLDDVERRHQRLNEPGVRKQLDDASALSEQLLKAAQAGADEALSLLEALMAKVTDDGRTLIAETEALNAELDRLRRDSDRILAGFEAINATEVRRLVRLAQATLVIQLAAVVIGLIFPWSARAARSIHLEYYAAVAGIAPVLLVAGFVELAILRLGSGVWGVLSFAIPAVGAGGASLVVLANHHSTPSTLYLTEWGLVTTLVLLILYVIAHATGPAAG